MSKFFKSSTWVLSLLLVASMVTLGFAAVGEGTLSPRVKAILAAHSHPSTAVAPCLTKTNQQSAPADWEVNVGFWGAPLTGRSKWAGKIKTIALDGDSVISVDLPILWDPLDSLGFGGTSGTPDLSVKLCAHNSVANVPNEGSVVAPPVVLPFATWQAMPQFPLSADGTAKYIYMTFTFPSPVFLPPLSTVWAVFERATTPGALIVLQDNPPLGDQGFYTADFRATRNPQWLTRSGVGIDVSMYYYACSAPYVPLSCTPGSESDWETQGNGFARTNFTTASISNRCDVALTWSKKPGGDCQMYQPIIAGGKIYDAGVDSLHCYDKTTGAQLWAFGGFPYIIGDLRGSPTVAGGFVYVGGAGAQAFSKVSVATGLPVWSRNLGGGDIPLKPGVTAYTPSVVSGGFVYFTQESGRVYKVSDATGGTANDTGIVLPDAPGAVPYNALTSDGTKLWVGTANTIGTAGNIHQIDMATMTIDWTLNNPGKKFFTSDTVHYNPEGFPGSMAYDGGVLYYHSHIRNDGNGFLHAPQTGSVGAIDVTLEDGTGAGLLWVNDAQDVSLAAPGVAVGSYNFSGPALGPSMVYLASRGFLSTDLDGISAWDRTLGARVWYNGYPSAGVSSGIPVTMDIRSDVPVSVICDGGVPYLFTSHVGGLWRLVNGNTGVQEWYRLFSGRVRGTAIADDCIAVHVRSGAPGGGGQLCVFGVGPDRPRLQIDSQFVFRSVLSGSGLNNDNIVDALQNSGCADLTVSSFNEVNPPAVRVMGVNPMLASTTQRISNQLTGYDALLSASTQAKLNKIGLTAGVDDEEEGADVARIFARTNAKAASDPLFLTVNTAAGVIGAGIAQTLNVDYDETGLTNNVGYTNFIEVDSDDPDYYPQDPTGAAYGLPFIQFEMFVGCPDAQDELTTGLGHAWLTNFGAEAGGTNFSSPGDDGFTVNGQNTQHFDGGWALVVKDSVHWAFDGCSVGGYPRRAGEWGPTLPCGLTVVANNYNSPLGVGADAVEEVKYNMIDLASPNGFHAPFTRQCGGVYLEVQRVGSQDPAFGDFVLTHINLKNEVGNPGDIVGALPNVYFGIVTDWDIASDNVHNYNDGYTQEDNGGGAPGTGSWMDGHVRLDANHVGAGGVGSGGAPTFMSADIQNDQGHGDAAFRMLSNPTGYCATVDPSSCGNTDQAALWSCAFFPSIADGASVDIYMAIFRVEDGVNGLPFVPGAAGAEAVYREVTCRAKAFAGFGKGDVNCDGCVDLQDVVALGNIVDGLLDPTGTAGVYTGDVNGDNAWTEADYTLLYDVVSGVQPASNMANGWRF